MCVSSFHHSCSHHFQASYSCPVGIPRLASNKYCLCFVHIVISSFFSESDKLPQCINLEHICYLTTKTFQEMEFQQSNKCYGRYRSGAKL